MRRLALALPVVLVLALTGCSSEPSSAADLLAQARAAKVPCAHPGRDQDTAGAQSVTCGGSELWYFATDKARASTVKLLATSVEIAGGDTSKRVLLGQHFAVYGATAQVEHLEHQTGGTVYRTDQVVKHLK